MANLKLTLQILVIYFILQSYRQPQTLGAKRVCCEMLQDYHVLGSSKCLVFAVFDFILRLSIFQAFCHFSYSN